MSDYLFSTKFYDKYYVPPNYFKDCYDQFDALLYSYNRKEGYKMTEPKFERGIEITDSDWVDTLWYDPDMLVLQMKTLTGKKYRYANVNTLQFSKIVTANSVGRELNKVLRELNHTTV